MNRRIGWVMLVAGVVFFGGVLSSHEKIKVGPPDSPAAESEEPQDQKAKQDEEPQDQQAPQGTEPQDQKVQRGAEDMETIAQLKEINTQLKELKELLRSGDVKVFVLMNPPEK